MSKIVVVDDSYAELQMIEGILKGANHTVVSYPNTEKLEDKLATERPDLIVLGLPADKKFNGHFRTSVTYKIVSSAPCPVLTVRDLRSDN